MLYEASMCRTATRGRSAIRRLALALAMIVAASPVARADETGESDESSSDDRPGEPDESSSDDRPGARDESSSDDRPAAPRTTWYGWETLLSDASVQVLGTAAGLAADAGYGSGTRQSYVTGAQVLIGAAVVVYGLGGPVVHLANGHAGKAAGSLGLRLALPVVGALAGLLLARATCQSGGEGDVPCDAIAGVFGFFGGIAAAVAIDAAVLARGPAEPATRSRLQAAFVPAGGGGTFVLGGRF
jgi:hypothetical protein